MTVPSTVQLLKDKDKFVVDNAVKLTPGVLVKPNRKAPLISLVGLTRIIGTMLIELYNSALASKPLLPEPPAANTCPLGNKVAV